MSIVTLARQAFRGQTVSVQLSSELSYTGKLENDLNGAFVLRCENNKQVVINESQVICIQAKS